MTTLEEIYRTLLDLRYCSNQQDFSRRWLGRSAGYYAYLKSSGTPPNLTSLGMLAAQIHAITPTIHDSALHAERAILRSAWVGAMTMWTGEAELRLVKPWERVTAVG